MDTERVIPEADLPDWIRLAKRGVDWGVLIVIVMSLAIGWSFILQEGLPRTNASENYVFRTEDTATALREGYFYPRWSPHAIYGMGAPIPNYYPPAPAYLPALIEVLFTNDSILAVRFIYLVSLCLAGAMTYALILRRIDAAAGVIGALLYVYSPYIGLVAPHVLGDLQGVMGLALLPAWLWALDRVYQRNNAFDFALLSTITAGVILTDPMRYGLVTFALSLPFTALHMWETRAWKTVGVSTIAVGVGIALSAFFWLPAFLEAKLVSWEHLDVPTALTVTWQTLLSPANQIDTKALIPPVQLTLGMTTIVFVMGSIVVMRFQKTRLNLQWTMLLCGFGLTVFTLWLAPHEYWLVGAITFCFAIGGTGLLQLRPYLRFRKIARQYFVGLVVAIFVLSIPVWISQKRVDSFGNITPLTQLRYEQQGYGIAVLPMGALIPTNTSLRTAPNTQLLTNYQDDNLNRIRADMTITDQIALLANGTATQRYQVRLPNVVNSTLLVSDFAGWSASLNNRLLPLIVDPNTVGMELVLPASGTGELVVTLTDTTIRDVAWAMSWGALTLIGLITWWNSRRSYPLRFTYSTLLTIRDARLLMAAILLSAGFGIATNLNLLPRTLRAEPGFGLNGTIPLNNRTNSAIEVMAYRLDRSEFSANDSFTLTLYWQAKRVVDSNYKIRVYMRDVERGQTVFSSDLQLVGDFPSQRWIPNTYVIDSHTIFIPSDTSAGRYTLSLDLIACTNRNLDCDIDHPLTFFDVNGNSIGSVFTLPRIITISN